MTDARIAQLITKNNERAGLTWADARECLVEIERCHSGQHYKDLISEIKGLKAKLENCEASETDYNAGAQNRF